MDHERELPQVEIRNVQGELVQTPGGVVYSATYRPTDDAGASEFNPSGSHSCAFCASPDWRWILRIRPSEPDAELAWAPHLVACGTCRRLCCAEQFDALRQRIVEEAEAVWMLEYLDDLLDRIIAFSPRR